MHAAAQYDHDTIAPLPVMTRRTLTRVASPMAVIEPVIPTSARMSDPQASELSILGLTRQGRRFRPSDWAERLAGALSSFRPGGAQAGLGAHIGYSPYCVPRVIDNVKCVIVSQALRGLEPMAWDFVMNFARDNDLQVSEACLQADRRAD